MKKLMHLFFCAIFVLSMVIPVSAVDDSYDELRSRMITAMENDEPLDISSYGLNRDEMSEIYLELFHRGLLPWYADTFCDWTAAPDGTIAVIRLRDLRKGTYRSFSEDEYERKMAELIAQTCYEGMTDIQKVLSVHDYIVSHTQYSYASNINNGYHALIRGETRCYGYSQLFLRVMNYLGIPCQIVLCDDTGNGVGHAWNVVELDGNWYHLDLTWDDPVPDAGGSAYHTYFLKTDKEFLKYLDHDFGWYPEIGCTDNSFSLWNLWSASDSPIIFLDSQTLILRQIDQNGSSIYSVNASTGKMQLLVSMDAVDFSTSLCYWNGRIWFNSADNIYSMNPDGSDLKVEHRCTTDSKDSYLYGFSLEDGTLHLFILTFKGDEYTVTKEQVELMDQSYHIHEYEAAYVSATCEAGGYTQKTCSCGITYQIDKTAPMGHALTEETSDDLLRRTCLNCDYTEEESMETDPAPTEQNPGKSKPAKINATGITLAILSLVIAAGALIFNKKK